MSLHKNWIPYLLLVCLSLILFPAILFGRRILYFGDIALYFVPLLAFQKSELLQGRIPLWNPRILCGTPFVGNPQAWPLYPSTLFLYVLTPVHAVAADGITHLVWAASGTYAFLRQRRQGRFASLFAAISWGFGGALVSKMQFPNMVQAASYLPWLLWSTDRLIDEPNLRRSGVLALFVGLGLLAAHPQMFLMQTYLGLAWTVWRLYGKSRGDRGRIVLWGGAALVVGVGLGAGQLLPVIQMAQTSVRSGLTLQHANRFILPPYAALYNFILPNFYGNPATNTEYIARGNFWEPCAYAGFIAFCLSVGAVFFLFRSSSEVRFWTAVAVIAVWLALGRESYLYAAAFYVLPGVAKFHDAARWLQPATFALSCLAAFGMNAVLAGIDRPERRFALAIILLFVNTADLFLFVRTLQPTTSPDLFADKSIAYAPRQRAFYADERLLWGRFVSYRSYGDTSRPFVQSDGPNLAAMHGYDLVNGYEPVHGERIDRILSVLDQMPRAASAAQLRLAGATVVIRLDPSTNRPFTITVPRPRGRAWLGDTPLTVRDISPDEVDIRLPDAHRAGALVLADAGDPGWVATIDDRSTPIEVANGAFREVGVTKNALNVRFRYIPTAWRFGAFVSLFASGILSAIWVPCIWNATLRRRQYYGRSAY